MVNVSNYKEVFGKFFRDVLRAVDSAGIANGFTTTVHHPKDYLADRVTLKPSGEWIDKRSYIIFGVKKQPANGPIISVNFVDIVDMNPDAQGSTSWDIEGVTYHTMIDTSSSKKTDGTDNRRSWRDRMSQQVLNTFNINKDEIYNQLKLVSLKFSVGDNSSNQQFMDIIQINFDGLLDS